MAARRAGLVLLAGVGLLALTIRLRGLAEQPMLLWDEGLFVTGARFLAWRAADPQAPADAHAGYPVFNEKPLHVLLQSVLGAPFDHDPAVGRFLSAAFGLATIGLVAARLWRLPLAGPAPAVLGALVLGASTYHVYYSRLGLHEIDSVFWLLAATTIAAGRGRRGLRAGLAGLCAGLALGSSYRWLPLLPLVVLRSLLGEGETERGREGETERGREGETERGREGERKEKSETAGRDGGAVEQSGMGVVLLGRLALFALGVGVVIAGCEALYRFAFWPDFVAYQPASYLEALRSKFTRETHFTLSEASFYLTFLLEMDGLLWPVSLLGLALVAGRTAGEGLQATVSPRGLLQLETLCFVLVPLGLFSISEAKVARAVSVISPWLAMAVGLAADALQRPAGRPPGRPAPAFVAFCVLVIAAAAWSAATALALPQRLQSGYPGALRFVAARSGAHLTSEAPISASLLGRGAVVWADLPRRALPASHAELLAALDEGARYLVLDWEKYLWYNRLLENLERRLEPVLVLDNPCVRFPALLHESFLPADARALRERPDIDKVLVYDLSILLAPGAAQDREAERP